MSVATAPFYTKQTPLLPAGDLRRYKDIMKNILCTFLVLLTVSANANSYKQQFAEGFSQWLHTKDFVKLLGSVPSDKYPAVLQGSALLGDGVVFRALLLPKPNQSFQHKFTYGTSKVGFTKLSNEYEKSGFILIQWQTVRLRSGLSYQGVWVKNRL